MRPMLIGTLIFSLTVMPVPSAFADNGNADSQKLTLRNVELNSAGQVKCRLLDGTGQPLAGQSVEFRTSSKAIKTTTSKNGEFLITSEHGGNCAVFVDKQAYPVRLWKHKTAPPKSLTSIGIVHGENPVYRGQDDGGFGFINGVSGSQLLGLGLLAGAVVAIVLAVEDDDDGS